MEMAVFDELLGAGPAAQELLVERKKQGVEAPAVEETAVVFLAGAPGGVARRQITPAAAVGELPEDGVEQSTRGGIGAAAAGTPGRQRLFVEDEGRGEAPVFLEGTEGLAGPRGMVDETPAVGGDEGGWDAAQVIGPGVDWQERR
jgi:hypothetical protein